MEEFKVTIEQFEGPLDLMLHLIKEKELNLFDLDINLLTDQYILYLQQMEQMHLEIASEYLVELAQLIEYKSKKLLPKDDSVLDSEYEENQKMLLVQRLLEYQQFKEVTTPLDFLFRSRQERMARPPSQQIDEWIEEETQQSYDGNPYDLMKAMKRVLQRLQLTKPIETRNIKREISMEERQLQVRARLKYLPKTFRFEHLLDDCQDMPMVIATFLAILDLARQHTIVFTVDENDAIWFSKGVT